MALTLRALDHPASLAERMAMAVASEGAALDALDAFLDRERDALVDGDVTRTEALEQQGLALVQACVRASQQRATLLQMAGYPKSRQGMQDFIASHASDLEAPVDALQWRSTGVAARLQTHQRLVRLHLNRSTRSLTVLYQAVGRDGTYNALGRLG